MPLTLLPASAAAFAPRSAPTVVLNSRAEPWLTQTLKRVNRVKRPLNSVSQHYRCLTDTLAGPNAIWSLASIMVPKAPDSELRKDDNPLIEALFNFQLIHIEAYVVHVDMVSQHEVAFKLTQDTIDSLVEYHKDIYSVDVSANTWNWSEKEVQLKKLQDDFVQAVNRYVYRTQARALEGLEDDGAGELLEGRSAEVKTAIMGLFLPLLPPPPRIVDVVAPISHMPGQHFAGHYWPAALLPPPPPAPPQMRMPSHLSAPTETWRVLGSSPSPTSAGADTVSSWSSSAPPHDTHLPSPAPSYSQPYPAENYYSSTHGVNSASSVPLPLPSVLAHCGPSASSAYAGLPWSYNDFSSSFPIQI